MATKIVAAAIRKGGTVYTGPAHACIIIPRTAKGKSVDGFVTSTGHFLTREEAFDLASVYDSADLH